MPSKVQPKCHPHQDQTAKESSLQETRKYMIIIYRLPKEANTLGARTVILHLQINTSRLPHHLQLPKPLHLQVVLPKHIFFIRLLRVQPMGRVRILLRMMMIQAQITVETIVTGVMILEVIVITHSMLVLHSAENTWRGRTRL